MAEYVLSGKKGAGKNLYACYLIDNYLRKGRPVAINMYLYLENFYINKYDVFYYRLPDVPTIEVLETLPILDVGGDDSKNGLIVFDECAIWLNARSFSDKNRRPVLDWLVHSRKKGWDVVYIVQHIEMLDKQIRDGFAEHLIVLKRLDRIPIPFLGWLLNRLGLGGRLPKYHFATTYYGSSESDLVVDRVVFNGRYYYDFYDTAQVYNPLSNQVGVSCSLPPRFYNNYTRKDKLKKQLKILFPSFVALFFVILFFYYAISSFGNKKNISVIENKEVTNLKPVTLIYENNSDFGRLLYDDGSIVDVEILSKKSGLYILKVDDDEITFFYR